MLRLLRAMLGLFAVSAATIALVIAAHYSDSRWGCASFFDMDGMISTLDLEHGSYFIDHPKRAAPINLVVQNYREVLLYDYRSPANVHRIGIVAGHNPTDTPHLDFTESRDFFARRDQGVPNLKYLPIMTYDRVTQTQTMTIYDLHTLAPLVSSVHTNVTLASSPRGDYERLPVAWSPNEEWFAFLSPTRTAVTVTLLSPARGLARSFPLTGSDEDVDYVWSLTGRALTMTSEHDNYADLFVASDDDWSAVQTYHLRARDPNAPLSLAYWSIDERSFYFLEPPSGADASTEYQFFAFRVDSQAIALAEGEQIAWTGLRLNNQWSCTMEGTGGTLTSLTNAHPPLVLADFGLTDGACTPVMQSPDMTRLVAATRASPTAAVTWIGLTADSAAIVPLSLPTGAQQIVAWSHDNRLALFFVPDAQTINDVNDGWLGILDTTTWQWKLVRDPIAIDLFVSANVYQSVSPDSTRILSLAADRQHTLLFDQNGDLVNSVQVAAPYPYLSINWSPDSTTFILTDYRDASRLTFHVYTRDGHLLTSTISPPTFGRWNSDEPMRGWTHCQPSLKLPRLNLPS